MQLAGVFTGLKDRLKHSSTLQNHEIRTTLVFLLLVVVAFAGLAWRCFYLQYCKSNYFADMSLRQQRSFYPQIPQRGAILDCRGRVLAASNRIRTIFAEPRVIDDPKETATKLAGVLHIGAHEICRLIAESGNPGFAKIKENAQARECIGASKIAGVGVQYDWNRHYPMGRLAAHVVGFTSLDNRGLSGIEFQFDENLQGLPARNTFLVDVQRRPVRSWRLDEAGPATAVDGFGVILTIDSAIQQFARAALLEQYESFQAESAVAIVVEPKTGAIRAIVSLPDFDPTNAHSADPRTFCNHAMMDQFEPGSIIKPIVAAIAIDAGAVNLHETIFCENGSYYGKGFGRIGEYREGFGDLTVRDILVKSSNIGMAKIGQKLGADKLHEGLKFFGFGKKVGIELPGEAEGLLRPAGEWTGYSVTRVPFGQEISVTAMQMVRAFCILANRGRLVHLHLIKALVDPNGEMIETEPSAFELGYVVKPDVAEWIVGEALTRVVNEGTGQKARLEQWQVFGKTGTAQLAKPDQKGYEDDAYIASFAGGAPVEDPRVVVLVSIRRPNKKLGKGYTGGAVAASVAGEILEKTLNYLNVPGRPVSKQKMARVLR